MKNDEIKNVSPHGSNTMLAAVQTYFVQYDWVGHERHCQIAATSEREVRDIFQRRFDFCCHIVKIQTVKDIANEISDKLMDIVRSQLNCG
jgi:hypothetical protein